MDVVRSNLLNAHGFAHAFSTRDGGVSDGPFASLNLGASVGDDAAHVAENHRRLAREVGYSADGLYQVSQVHGANVVLLGQHDAPHTTRVLEADAIVSPLTGRALAVRVADCAPVLIANLETRAVAAVHAGWRGVVARVLDRAIDALGETSKLIAAIGPHIRAPKFEVGEDVAQQIAGQAHGREVIVRGYDKPHVDLAIAICAQLEARGLARSRIDDCGLCTVADSARFFSFRRDGAKSGRMVGVIVG